MYWLLMCSVILGVNSAIIHKPSYLLPCSKTQNFSDCALDHATKAIPHLLKGNKKLGLPSFTPLDITEIKVKGTNHFNIHLKHLKVYGLENTKPLKIVVDFKKQQAKVLSTVPVLTVLGDYNMTGKILMFNLHGFGPVNITLANGLYEYGFDWDLETRDGVEYGRILKSSFDYHLTGVEYHFDNVINGDKEFSKRINDVLNQNWQMVNDDLKDSIRETLLIIHDHLFAKIFTQIPNKELFLD